VNIVVRGGKVYVNMSDGAEISGKNCLRGVKMNKTVRGSQAKICPRGVKIPIFI